MTVGRGRVCGWIVVAVEPVTTSALRLEVTLTPEWSAGIQEWKVR